MPERASAGSMIIGLLAFLILLVGLAFYLTVVF